MNQENYNASSKTYNQPIKKKKITPPFQNFQLPVATQISREKKKKNKDNNNKFTSTLKKNPNLLQKETIHLKKV